MWIVCIYAYVLNFHHDSFASCFSPTSSFVLIRLFLHSLFFFSRCFRECVCAYIYQNIIINYATINTKTMLTTFIYAVYVSFWIIYVNTVQVEWENFCCHTHAKWLSFETWCFCFWFKITRKYYVKKLVQSLFSSILSWACLVVCVLDMCI